MRSSRWIFCTVCLFKCEVLLGHAIDEIGAAAGDPDVDLVVTSTHGRSGLNHV